MVVCADAVRAGLRLPGRVRPPHGVRGRLLLPGDGPDLHGGREQRVRAVSCWVVLPPRVVGRDGLPAGLLLRSRGCAPDPLRGRHALRRQRVGPCGLPPRLLLHQQRHVPAVPQGGLGAARVRVRRLLPDQLIGTEAVRGWVLLPRRGLRGDRVP